MSKSNHHYHNICNLDSVANRSWGTETHCWYHRNWYYDPYLDEYKLSNRPPCLKERSYETRRGIYHRRRRFPNGSIKSIHSTPPASIKKMWHKLARAKQKREFLNNPDDPMITPMKRLIEIWNWY